MDGALASTRWLTIILATALLPTANAATTLRVVSTADLPGGVIARDIRWAGPSEVYVSVGREGVIRTSVTRPSLAKSIMPVAASGGFPLAGLVASGTSHLFVASPMGLVGWMSLAGTTRKVEHKALIAVMDIDARGDRAAILGADGGDVTGLARDGTIAWIGSLSRNLADLRPLLKGRSNPGGKDMARCSVLETGAIRFMADGSVVVVPGVEPGIYRYGPDGKLLQTWDSGSLGIIDNCSIADDELALIAADFPSRIAWYASRIMVDDILPMSDGPALLLRRVDGKNTKWDLVRLSRHGKPQRLTVPVSVPTNRGHARGDARGNQIVLIVFDDALPGGKAAVPTRIISLDTQSQ